jgi:two-component system sensor histidine kinase EvgS
MNLQGWCCVLWLSITATSWASEPAQHLELLAQAELDNIPVALDERDRQWLRQHPVLRMGISGADYPPFEITRNQHELEGLTADYAELLAQLLGVRIDVQRFANREQVMAALKQGELDLLGTSNSFELADPDFVLSRPYADDQPMLVTRLDETLPADLAGKRIAMVEDYLPLASVQAFYPEAQVLRYPSAMDALGAVAFGVDDGYLGDLISTNYLINTNYRNDLQLAGPSGWMPTPSVSPCGAVKYASNASSTRHWRRFPWNVVSLSSNAGAQGARRWPRSRGYV